MTNARFLLTDQRSRIPTAVLLGAMCAQLWGVFALLASIPALIAGATATGSTLTLILLGTVTVIVTAFVALRPSVTGQRLVWFGGIALGALVAAAVIGVLTDTDFSLPALPTFVLGLALSAAPAVLASILPESRKTMTPIAYASLIAMPAIAIALGLVTPLFS